MYQFLSFDEVFLASAEQLRKGISGAVIQVLHRGATAEDTGKGSVPGRSQRVLLRYRWQHYPVAIKTFVQYC